MVGDDVENVADVQAAETRVNTAQRAILLI